MSEAVILGRMNDGLIKGLEEFAWVARELPIRFFGDDVLGSKCEPLADEEFDTGEVTKISDELVSTLKKYREHTGLGRGLAANQIGHSKRIIAVWLSDEPQIFCNPSVVKSEGRGSYPESCISSGGLLVGEVQRAWRATFEYQDIDGKQHKLAADEKQTRVLLHEIDHLDGITCNEKYQPRTMRFVAGGKDELLGFSLNRIG